MNIDADIDEMRRILSQILAAAKRLSSRDFSERNSFDEELIEGFATSDRYACSRNLDVILNASIETSSQLEIYAIEWLESKLELTTHASSARLFCDNCRALLRELRQWESDAFRISEGLLYVWTHKKKMGEFIELTDVLGRDFPYKPRNFVTLAAKVALQSASLLADINGHMASQKRLPRLKVTLDPDRAVITEPNGNQKTYELTGQCAPYLIRLINEKGVVTGVGKDFSHPKRIEQQLPPDLQKLVLTVKNKGKRIDTDSVDISLS